MPKLRVQLAVVGLIFLGIARSDISSSQTPNTLSELSESPIKSKPPTTLDGLYEHMEYLTFTYSKALVAFTKDLTGLKSENQKLKITNLGLQNRLDQFEDKTGQLISENNKLKTTDLELKNRLDQLETKTGQLTSENKANKIINLKLQNRLDQLQNTTGQTGLLKPASGRLVSVNETDRSWDDQELGCGGILVGESGQISYHSPHTMTSKIRCIWTVRANRRSNVTFQLVSDQFGKSTIKLLPLTANFLSIWNGQSKTLYAANRDEYTLEGPVVFVTLLVDPNTPVNFTLRYEGKCDVENGTRKLYSHYHYRENSGSVDYPNIRGGVNYSPNEIATFVLNPPETEGGIKVQLMYADIERHDNCTYDSLTYYHGRNDRMDYYARHGPAASGYMNCGNLGELPNILGVSTNENFLAIFKSDNSNEGKGFKFNWTMPFN